jgi:hypothetical protein
MEVVMQRHGFRVKSVVNISDFRERKSGDFWFKAEVLADAQATITNGLALLGYQPPGVMIDSARWESGCNRPVCIYGHL